MNKDTCDYDSISSHEQEDQVPQCGPAFKVEGHLSFRRREGGAAQQKI